MFEVGEDYTGLFKEDYDAIRALGNETINSWLDANMTSVAGGAFYIYTGDGTDDSEFELIETLQDIDSDELVTYFVYLKSTWSVAGM